LKNPNEWHSRKHMGFVAVLLVAIGIWVAIVFLPEVPILSLLLFALIGGPGVFIGYKQKKTHLILFFGFLIASWGYAFSTVFGVGFTNAFFYDFMTYVMPVVLLGTLPFAWFGRWKTPGYTTFKSAFYTYGIYLIVIVPFVFSGMWDYNVRADTSPPQVIRMKVVHKSVNDEGVCSLQVETPDGDLSFWISVSRSFYDERDIGSSVMVTVRGGALGYEWVEGYT